MKIYIDDIREAPEGWHLCRTISEAIRAIARFTSEIDEISLDHDISFEVRIEGTYRPFPSPDTFASVAYFIGEVYRDSVSPKITAHTANPVGAENIKSILKGYGIDCEIKMMGEAHRKK